MRKITFILMLSLVSLVGRAALPYDWTTFFATGAINANGTQLETGNAAAALAWNAGTAAGATNPFIETNTLSYTSGANNIDNTAGKQILLRSDAAAEHRSVFYLATSTSTYTAGTYYLSAIINVSAAPSTSKTFIAFEKLSTGTTQRGRVYIKSSGSGFELSTGVSSSTSVASSVLAFDTNHFIVLKYTITGTATTTLDASLFINPAIGGTEGAATLTGTQIAGAANDYIRGIVLIQNTGLGAKIAGLRFGTSWADATKGKLSTPSVTTGATSITSSGCRANWSSVASASSYTVIVYNENGSTNQTITGVSNAATYTDITGLTASSNYTYKVTAVGNGTNILDSDQSLAASFSTSASVSPTLSVGTLTGFGNQVINTTSGANSFTITGTNLTTADVTIGALSGYSYSTSEGGTYANTLTISQSGGSFSQTVYVKFTPTAAQSYNGNIAVGGGGASSVNCAVTGAVILGEPSSQASNVTFSNLISTGSTTGGFTINWTAGDGANHIVLVKSASAVDANPVDANTYTANTAFGSGSQIGTGNYVVFSGTGSSVAVTGLTKGTTYYVKVYTYNNSGGSENYLTSGPASGSQLALGTITSTASGNWSTAGTWVGGVVPGINDNVVIAGSTTVDVTANASCYNMTINSGGKIWANTTARTLTIYGTLLTCNGTFGDTNNALTTGSQLTLNYANNLTISGVGNIYPYILRPVTALSNIGVTFNAAVTVTYGTVSILTDNTNNDNITYTINPGVTVTTTGALSTSSSQSYVGTGNVTVNIYGTLTIGGTLNTTLVSGKTYALTVYNGGLLEVSKTNSTKTFYICPSHAVQNANFTVNSGGEIKVYGIADCSNSTYTGTVTGTGTFSLLSGATMSLAAAGGLEPTNGPIRTTTRNFNSAANYTFVGSVAQLTGSEMPATINNLTINNASGVTLTNATILNGILNLTSGTLTNTAGLTFGNSASVVRTGGLLSATPTFGSALNVTYDATTTQSATTTISSTNVTLSAANANIVVGMSVSGTGIANGTTVATVSGTSLSLSQNATASGTNTLSFCSAQTTGNDFPTGTTIPTLTVNNTAGLTLNANLTNVTNLTIGTNGILNVNPGKQLTVGTTFTNNGTLNLLSNASGTASYVDPTTTSGIGTATVQQYLTSGRNWYMSVPVQTASTTNFSTAGSVVRYYEPNGLWYTQTVDSVFNPMRGYISAATASTGAITFSGTLNTGAKSITLTRTSTAAKPGFNLVGNPYPSFVNWESATKTNLETTMWYRSRNTGNSAYIFDTFNATTHAGTGNNGTAVTTNIPPMQAFWVRVASGFSTGSLAFDNTMRSHGSGTERMKAPQLSEQQLLRLQVSNDTNSDEAIVVFNANASNNLDAYDSYKMSNNNSAVPEIYTLVANEELVINGMNTNNLETEIPLGFRTGTLSTFSIKATEATNFKSDTRIILKDNVLNKQTDLTDGSQYTFSSDVANTTGRFSLVFKSAGVTTDVESTNSSTTNLIFVNNNGQIVVQNTTGLLRSINIYNSIGQLVEKRAVLNTITTSSKLNTGVYFVHFQNENNKNTVCKVKVD